MKYPTIAKLSAAFGRQGAMIDVDVGFQLEQQLWSFIHLSFTPRSDIDGRKNLRVG